MLAITIEFQKRIQIIFMILIILIFTKIINTHHLNALVYLQYVKIE